MDILKKEPYFSNDQGEDISGSFIDEIAGLRAKHQLKPSKGKIALLIMDMQKFFFSKDSHAFIPAASSIVERVRTIKNRCEDLGVPVIFTRHLNSPENAGKMK